MARQALSRLVSCPIRVPIRDHGLACAGRGTGAALGEGMRPVVESRDVRDGGWVDLRGLREVGVVQGVRVRTLALAARTGRTPSTAWWRQPLWTSPIRMEPGAFDPTSRALELQSRLLKERAAAGIGHFSVANATTESKLPYFMGKGQVKELLKGFGVSYAITWSTVKEYDRSENLTADRNGQETSPMLTGWRRLHGSRAGQGESVQVAGAQVVPLSWPPCSGGAPAGPDFRRPPYRECLEGERTRYG